MERYFPCRSTPISKLGRYTALLLYPSIGVLLLVVPVVIGVELHINRGDAIVRLISLLFAFFAILLSSFLFIIGRKCYRMETRHIAVDSLGFTIRKKVDRHYTWDAVSDIGIIIYAANAGKQCYQTQICIFLRPVDNNALEKLCNSYLYGAFNQDKYILIDYSQVMVERIEECSHMTIADFRARQMNL